MKQKANEAQRRLILDDLKRRDAEHQRKQGKQPSEREINKTWNRIAEQTDRKRG